MNYKDYNNKLFSPDYIRYNPVIVTISSLENKFEKISPLELKRGSIKLKQTLSSENYFLWGGFNASQLEFECYASRFAENPPDGKIQLTLTPTSYTQDGEFITRLDDKSVNLFTGYIEAAEPTPIPGHWKITAYDRLYRVRNNKCADFVECMLKKHLQTGNHASWLYMANLIATTQLGLFGDEFTDEWMKNVWVPDDITLSSENGVELLRQFAFMSQRYGMIDGNGDLRYIQVQDSKSGSEAYVINTYNPANFKYSAGYVWQPHFFTSEPTTNMFYTAGDIDSEDEYWNNVYTIKNSPILGGTEWIESCYDCNEYGTPNSRYSVNTLPPGLFDTSRLCISADQEFYQQEYNIRVYADPTIPMGSILHIKRNGKTLVRSYIMQRTITIVASQLIQCEYSAQNAPYNTVVEELEATVGATRTLAERANARLPVMSNEKGITKIKVFKTISQSEYDKIEKRDDTIYWTYNDGGNSS